MLNSLKRRFRNHCLDRWRLRRHCEFGRTSFSQDGEDVLLWRLMDRDHSPAIYVDVGCNHPYRMSNTALLYEHGWSGIAIDANPDFATDFHKLRPRDTFINTGIGSTPGSLTYFRFEEPLFNTFDPDKAKTVASKHSRLLAQVPVEVQPLSNVLRSVWPDGMPIRFMSVDCEGMDDQVVMSHDFDAYPVEFVCVEVDSLTYAATCQEPVMGYMLSLGFVPISKLCRSVLMLHRSVQGRWGLDVE